MSAFTYCDIEILIDEQAEKKPGFAIMQEWHNKCKDT